MAGCIMIQGTASSVGKSLMVAGLCRLLRQDGYRVAPFKSQNMSYAVTLDDGSVIASSTIMQAEAAGVKPSRYMNPILLRPTGEKSSEVYVNGRSQGFFSAQEYHRKKPKLMSLVRGNYDCLAAQYDVVVIEGAGSPAEINLRENDLVNMGLAELVDAPVVLVGDIDRGGVFAALAGTMLLLQLEERARVKGVIINKFRGDLALLGDGLKMLEEIIKVPVLGVVPYMTVDIAEEDSLGDKACHDEVKLRSASYRSQQYDRLAQGLRDSLDMEAIYRIIDGEGKS